VRVFAKKETGQNSKSPPVNVTYGADWYTSTRQAAKSTLTVREELERRRAANSAANNGRERKDLYTDNWCGALIKILSLGKIVHACCL